MIKVRTRIAPSPTGSPHIGTAYAALFNYCFAKKNGGDFVLRIEDTDRTRFVEGSEQEIFEALSWLGLSPDESPSEGGKFGPYRQSERLEIYNKHVQVLIKENKAYYCDCTPERLTKLREEQQKVGEVPRYDKKCFFDPPKTNKNTVVRMAVAEEGETVVEDEIRGKVVFKNKLIDDQVLLKSDGFPTYHLASVVDDHLMEITHVIRAEEWLSSTPKHVLLHEAFGWEKPKFAHLPLLRNTDKSKISKRKNPVAIDFYRQQGYLPEALRNFLGLMGWSMPEDQEIFSLEEMIQNFTFDRIDPSGPVFDIQKLEWLNGEYIRMLSDEELSKRLLQEGFTNYSEAQVREVLPLVKERMKKLSEFDSLVDYFFEEIKLDEDLINQHSGTIPETKEVLLKFRELLEQTDWKEEKLEENSKLFVETTSLSRKELFMLLRVILTGRTATPPLFETMVMLGKQKTLSRLEQALKQL